MSAPVTLKKSTHIPGMETYREKATRKFKENPWVPLGSLATVGALVTAMVKMKRGESHSFNHWLRVRVVAQGLTVAAILVGTYSLRPKDTQNSSTDPTLTRNDLDTERRRLEKMAREKGEFEERLRGAEEAHLLESRVRTGSTTRESTDPGTDSGSHSAVSSRSWLGWLGWGRSSSSSPQPPSSEDSRSGQGDPPRN